MHLKGFFCESHDSRIGSDAILKDGQPILPSTLRKKKLDTKFLRVCQLPLLSTEPSDLRIFQIALVYL